jgi:hypothetical protein
MRYEDLFKARMVRDTKDKAAVDKGTGKHGPKRQSYTQDEEEETVGGRTMSKRQRHGRHQWHWCMGEKRNVLSIMDIMLGMEQRALLWLQP